MTDPHDPPGHPPPDHDPLDMQGDIGPFPRLDRDGEQRSADFDPRWPTHRPERVSEPGGPVSNNLFEALDNPEPDPRVPEPERIGPEADALAPDPQSNWLAGADPHDLIEPVPAVEAARHPLQKLGRFAFPPTPPLDDTAAAARDQRWAGQVILVTTLFLAVFNAASVQDWVRQQPPGWTTSTVRGLSDIWTTQLSLLGADQPRRGIRELWDKAHEARFIGQPPAPAETD